MNNIYLIQSERLIISFNSLLLHPGYSYISRGGGGLILQSTWNLRALTVLFFEATNNVCDITFQLYPRSNLTVQVDCHAPVEDRIAVQ